jgi:hypothetical protein
MPLVASRQGGGPDTPGNAQIERHRPALHGLLREFNAACGQQLLDHARAKWEPLVLPHRVADHVGRAAIARI